MIEEKLEKAAQGDNLSQIEIGDLVESMLKSEFGGVLKALTAGRLSHELQKNLNGGLSADRVLGRVEMANMLWSDLEQYVIDKDSLRAEIKESNKTDSHVATEPAPEGI